MLQKELNENFAESQEILVVRHKIYIIITKTTLPTLSYSGGKSKSTMRTCFYFQESEK